MSRRTVLRVLGATGALGLGVAGWWGRTIRLLWSARWGGQKLAAVSPLAPSEVGELSAQDEETLFALFEAVRAHWKLSDVVSRAELGAVFSLKTGEAPSYLAEYRAASAAFDGLRARHGAEQALVRLLEAERAGADGSFTPEAHVQDWVIGEMLNLLLMRGAFRQFGVTHYPGFAGGPAGYRKAVSTAASAG